ncbi:MAG: hypothetical protein R2830_11630 [Saprospiraceae bacterium]
MEENKLTPEEEQRIENELKALDLELTFGADTFISGDAPPEVISQWLDNVKNYEAQYANATKVPVYDFIGQPDIVPPDKLKEDEIEPAIEQLLKRLEEKCVLIDRPEHLSPQDYYRFLTEDFMQHPMTDHAAPGMMHFFSYDEFHHDGPEFIKDHVSDFLLDLLNLDHDFEGAWLSENCRDDLHAISRTEVLLRCNAFRAQHRELKPLAFQPENAQVHDGTMYLIFGIAWEAAPVIGEKKTHEGMGICQLGWEDGEWMVQGVNMPGFSF